MQNCLSVLCYPRCSKHQVLQIVSFVPYNKSYAVEVDFPDGLVTTNRKEIKYEIDMSGRAEIITSSRSILSRIFAPVYELFSTTE